MGVYNTPDIEHALFLSSSLVCNLCQVTDRFQYNMLRMCSENTYYAGMQLDVKFEYWEMQVWGLNTLHSHILSPFLAPLYTVDYTKRAGVDGIFVWWRAIIIIIDLILFL